MSGVHSDLVEVIKTAEAPEGQGVQKIFQGTTELVEVDRTKCTKASGELYSMWSRYTGSEAATIVRSVKGLYGVEARRRLGCTFPKVATDMNHVKPATGQWEDKWTNRRYDDS